MSGPKIVDIRVLQAIQERQRRLQEQRLKQLQNQWRSQRKRLEQSLKELQPLANSEVIGAMEKSMTAMDRRFEKIQEADSLEDLQRRGEQQLQFMASELDQLREQMNNAITEVRQRSRSMQAAANDLAARLQAAGLVEESRSLLQAPSAAGLELAAQQLGRKLRNESDQDFRQALADLAVEASPARLEHKAVDPERERIEKLLVQLELLDDSNETTGLRSRLEALDGEQDQRQRRLLLDSLSLELSQTLQRRAREAQRLAILDELEAQLGVFNAAPTGLKTAISAFRDGQGASLSDLRHAVEAWCEQEALRLDGERVRSVVLGSLRELGYDVREGMTTAWVEGGSIVVQKAGSSEYGVELQDVDGRMRTELVRFGDPGAPVTEQQRQRDTEIEQQWCTAHAQTLENLRKEGMAAKVMAKREPGEVTLTVRRAAADRSDASTRGVNRGTGTAKEKKIN
ncbi:MAG: hypothetical protein NTZ40_12635 [Cyanobacteria bacterium]|nr:hypothetical protein [Cyanobacteriota bacterium]